MDIRIAQTVLKASRPFSTVCTYRNNYLAATLSDMTIETHAQVVGRRIAQARDRRKREGKPFTQEWLADAIGLKQRAVSNYENGHREPDLETLGKLAAALECDPLWLGALDSGAHAQRESVLLDLFRQADSRGQDTIIRIAESQPGYLIPGDKKAIGK